jgi:ribitol 2-dehydrogenase
VESDSDAQFVFTQDSMVLNELWGITDPAEIDNKVSEGTGLRSEDVAEAIEFMLTRPRNVTIRDLVMLPRAQAL